LPADVEAIETGFGAFATLANEVSTSIEYEPQRVNLFAECIKEI